MTKLKIERFPEFIGKTRQELYDHLIKEGYNLADKKDLEECIKNPPEYMKDGNWYCFFGTILRNQDGNVSVPVVNLDGDKLGRSANWLRNDWNSIDRVVLLETLPFESSSLETSGIYKLNERVLKLEEQMATIKKFSNLL